MPNNQRIANLTSEQKNRLNLHSETVLVELSLDDLQILREAANQARFTSQSWNAARLDAVDKLNEACALLRTAVQALGDES